MSSLPKHYTPVAQLLHWSMATIWLVAWTLGFLAVHWRDFLNPEFGLTFLHKSLASSLLLLVVVRVAWRLAHPPPALPATVGPLARKLARYGHLTIYGLALIGLPISGWLWSSVAGKAVLVFGVLPLPAPLAENPQLYPLMKDVHQYLAWLCGALIAGHAAMALKHHFIDRDGVLRSMLPFKRR